MESIIDKKELITSVRLTAGDGHYFFGYYDVPAFSGNGRFHLAHKSDFCDRLPEAGDRVELGTIDLNNHVFSPFAETTAWNFQQGSMLQWNPSAPNDEVIYNVTEAGQYRGVVRNIHNGAERMLQRPVAAVDPLGHYALSINFGRMFDFRPGYGYADVSDPYQTHYHSPEDGIFHIDLRTGASQLVLSLEEIWRFIQPIFHWNETKLLINHITINPEGTRFVFLARSVQPEKGWSTALLTANADGSGLHCLSDSSFHSHYYWKSGQQLLMYGGGNRQGKQLYLYHDRAFDEPEIVDSSYFLLDGHCSYSPDRQWILYDSYPDAESYRHLYLYHCDKRKGVTLGSYYAPPRIHRISTDIRCDLHPRWNRDGSAISFDSLHENQRHIYGMDLRECMQRIAASH